MMRFRYAYLFLFVVAVLSEPNILPHEEHVRQFGHIIPKKSIEEKQSRRRPMVSLSHEIYGFLPYWEYGGYLPPRFDLISRVAYFNITLNEYGNVSYYRDWPTADLIAAAHAQGCKVDLCVAVFDDTDIGSIVNSSINRSNACRIICEQMALGADGVNIDFELPSTGHHNGFYAFIRELSDSIHARDMEAWLSVCLPSVDWRSTFDSDSLLPYADALFLMGYGYYWGGSSNTGPVAPLDDPGCYYDIAYSVDYYCGPDSFKRSRFIVGLPVYGYDWPCSGDYRGASTSGDGSARFYSSCVSDTLTYGCNWDGNAPAPWYVYGSYHQCWWDDVRSLGIKYRWAVAEELMGIGWWALGYDDGCEVFWGDVEEVFGSGAPGDTIIDDYSFGFSMEGDGSFWHEADTGYNGHMWWTYSTAAMDPSDDTCFCIWTPDLPDRRNYEVFTYIPAVHSVASGRYAIDHDFGSDTVIVSQALHFDEWVSLGTYSFEDGEGGMVYLGDGTGVVGERIGFDAVWWSDRGALLAPDTLVTIETDGFRWGGPIEWRRIVLGGFGGIYYWTNSITYGPDVSSGCWVPCLPCDGDYGVYVYIPNNFSEATAVYKIAHSGGIDEVVVDQSGHADEWVYLGSWRFLMAESSYVYLGDSTGVTGENIAVDAMVWRFIETGIASNSRPAMLSIDVFPNPFNSSVRILLNNYRGVGASKARSGQIGDLKIYDITGNLVAELPVPSTGYDGGGGAVEGSTPLIWTPDENTPSGIYFVKLELGSKAYKIILMR